MKKTFLGLLLTLVASGVFAKAKHECVFNNSIRQLNLKLKVDSKLTPYYDSETQLYYGFYNDTENLYILIKTNNKETAEAIIQHGAEFSLYGKYGERISAEIKYVPSERMHSSKVNRPNKKANNIGFSSDNNHDKRPTQSHKNKGMPHTPKGGPNRGDLKEHFSLNRGTFNANGFLKTNGILKMEEPRELHAEINWPTHRFLNIYIKVPINEFANSPYDWKTLSKKGIKLVVETQKPLIGNEPDHQPMRQKSSGGMGGPGGGPGGGPDGGMGGMGGMGDGPSGGRMNGGPQMKDNNNSSTKLKYTAKLKLAPLQIN